MLTFKRISLAVEMTKSHRLPSLLASGARPSQGPIYTLKVRAGVLRLTFWRLTWKSSFLWRDKQCFSLFVPVDRGLKWRE